MSDDNEKQEFSVVGESRPMHNAERKVTGEAEYPVDLEMPGMLYANVVRSPHFHARIRNIDTSEAEKIDGVEAVITAEDIPGLNRLKYYIEEEPVIAEDKVRYKGEAVAAVAARSEQLAKEAAEKIEVEYEVLDEVLDPYEAMEDDSPLLFEEPVIEGQDGNVIFERKLEKGDIDKGFEDSDIVVEGEYSTPLHDHAYLAPDAALTYMESDGTIVVEGSTQCPHVHQREIAKVLGEPTGKVRFNVPDSIGGAFGGKIEIPIQPIAAALTYHTEKPVKLIMTREEVFQATCKRHPFYMKAKTGVNEDGELQAFKLEIIEDTGAYAKAGPPVLMRAITHVPGPYEFPNLKVNGKVVYTNNPPCAAMRGFGAPQVLLTLETQLREISDKLDMSPVELRKKNGFKEGSETGTGQVLETDPGYQKILDEVEPVWKEWEKEIEDEPEEDEKIKKGVGMAGTWFGIGKTGLPSSDTMRTELTSDGEIILYNGVAEIGQGSTTAMTMIAAEELSQEPEDIKVVEMDTRYTEDCDLSCASRQTLFGGSAAKRSAEKLAERIKEKIASVKDCEKEEVQLASGRKAIVNGEEIPLSEITEGESFEGMGEFVTPERVIMNQKEVKGTPYLDYTYGATVVEVEVDTETGSVEVERVKTVFNTGKAINPLYVEGQLDGGVGWGVSQALKEEYKPGETDNFTDYIILGALETPEIDSSFVDVPQSSGEYGQVGIGECAHYPILPAVANAINDACGVWIRDLPITSERVREKTSGGW